MSTGVKRKSMSIHSSRLKKKGIERSKLPIEFKMKTAKNDTTDITIEFINEQVSLAFNMLLAFKEVSSVPMVSFSLSPTNNNMVVKEDIIVGITR